VEKELEKLAQKVRESSEMTSLQENAQLKGQLAEFEVRLEREHAECKKAQEEKEQYKNQINRLVSQRFVNIFDACLFTLLKFYVIVGMHVSVY
jgi:hypothetical protein